MKLLFLSGKGGTGKTTVVVNLAIALKQRGLTAAVWDADVEEPDCRCFLSMDELHIDAVDRPVPVIERHRCDLCGICATVCEFNALALAGERVIVFPELCHGCDACRRLCPRGAVRMEPYAIGEIERGFAGGIPLVSGRLRVGELAVAPLIDILLAKVPTGGLHLIDGPPGTGCAAAAAVRAADVVVLVAEPTPFGRHDLERAWRLAAARDLPILLVINRVLDDEGLKSLRVWAGERDLKVLTAIPASRNVAARLADGAPLAGCDPAVDAAFASLADAMIDLAGAVA